MNGRIVVLIMILASLIYSGFFITTGMAPVSSTNSDNIEEIKMAASDNGDPVGTPDQGTQIPAGLLAVGLKLSGEVLTCTKITDYEKRIDLRLSSLDEDNSQSISIFPLSITIDLDPKQIKRIDLFLPAGVSTLDIVSSNREELTLQVPPCISRGGSSGFYSSAELFSNPPPPVPELSTIALTGIGVFGLIFIISRGKQN